MMFLLWFAKRKINGCEEFVAFFAFRNKKNLTGFKNLSGLIASKINFGVKIPKFESKIYFGFRLQVPTINK